MLEILSIFFVGIALSMDTFSLSLGIGTFNISNKKALVLSTIVGIMHFLMPFFGVFIGSNLTRIFKLNSNFLLGLILIVIGLEMLYSIIKKEDKSFDLSVIGMFLFAFGVSLDSFSTGLGLHAITQNIFLAMTIFTVCSFSFTYLGLILGKYSSKYLGVYATLGGAILLLLIGIFHLFR